MSTQAIRTLQGLFQSRLAVLGHVLDMGARHLPDIEAALQSRLAPDMFPLGSQFALACNQPRGFAFWCAGKPVDNLSPQVDTVDQARTLMTDTGKRVAELQVDDDQLDKIKRVGMGPGRHCDLTGHQYVSDYLLPNLYFHVTTAYAIVRHLGVPIGKADYLCFLKPRVKMDADA